MNVSQEQQSAWYQAWRQEKNKRQKFTIADLIYMEDYIDKKMHINRSVNKFANISNLFSDEFYNHPFNSEFEKVIDYPLIKSEENFNKAMALLDEHMDSLNDLWDKYVALYPDYLSK